MNTDAPFNRDPEYVQGQIDSLRALVLALAQSVPKEHFRSQGLQRLEMLRTAILGQPVAESRLAAVDHAEAWLRKVTS